MACLLVRGASVGNAKGAAAWSSLINACHANGRPAAAEFLAKRADMLDLEAAAGVGRLDLVKRFFNADGTLKGDATEEQMKDGFTWACEYGRTDVVDSLLQNGMDVAAKAQTSRPDRSALGGVRRARGYRQSAAGTEHASSSRYYDVVRLLVNAGATLNEKWLADSNRGFPLEKKIREDARMRAALGTIR
jgi:hypothetical protein